MIHLTIFGEMSHWVSMVLARKVHGVAKIYPITRLLTLLKSYPITRKVHGVASWFRDFSLLFRVT
jgi:hypothetical protein